MPFTIIDADGTTNTFTRFSRLASQKQPKSGQVIVIAWFDGEPELWLLESETAITDLLRYYKEFYTADTLPVTLTRVE